MADLDWTKHIPSHVPSSARTHLSSSEMKKYVIFSEHTKGNSGCPVRIKVNLFSLFASIIDSSTHAGKVAIEQIENLRHTTGAAQGGLSNINCAFKKRHTVNGMHVYYSILDDTELGKRGIFITDIRPDFGDSKGTAGIYAYNSFQNKIMEQPNIDLSEKSVYINGLSNSLDDALEKARNRIKVADSQLAVFYLPSNIVTELGVWRDMGQSQVTQKAIESLRSIMQKNAQKKVYWTAEGEGVALVDETIRGISGKLKKYRMNFINPIVDTVSMLQNLKVKGIRIGGGSEEIAPISYTGQNRTAQILLEANAQLLTNELSRLRVTVLSEPAHEQMLDKITGFIKTSSFSKANGSLMKNQNKGSLPQNLSQNKPAISSPKLTFVSALNRLKMGHA